MNSPESPGEADILAFANALSVLLAKAAEAGALKALEQLPNALPDTRAGNEVLNRREGAALLKVSVATFDRLGLPKHYVGCMPRYLRSELLAWVAKQKGTQ